LGVDETIAIDTTTVAHTICTLVQIFTPCPRYLHAVLREKSAPYRSCEQNPVPRPPFDQRFLVMGAKKIASQLSLGGERGYQPGNAEAVSFPPETRQSLRSKNNDGSRRRHLNDLCVTLQQSASSSLLLPTLADFVQALRPLHNPVTHPISLRSCYTAWQEKRTSTTSKHSHSHARA